MNDYDISFVSRNRERTEIVRMIHRAYKYTDIERTLCIIGNNGMGKTTLINKIREQFPKNQKIKFITVNCNKDTTELLNDAISVSYQNGKILHVLILEDIDKTPNSVITQNEHMLSSFLNSGNFIIMTCKKLPYFYYDRRLIFPKVYRLKPLDISILSNIQELKPYPQYIEACQYPYFYNKIITTSPLCNMENVLLDSLHCLLSDIVDDANAIEKMLETWRAVPILRHFDHDRIAELTQYDKQSINCFMELFILHNLIHFDIKHQAYSLDNILQTLWDKYIETKNNNEWSQLHSQSIYLYSQWMMKYPQNKEKWNREVEYHRSKIL